ncbi:MAG: putative NADPH-flavin oxidoreductase [Promethearchaeota archaeon]|nr:MAG: putative NADPH-flavin oxidoreductase [Candidatus Lokiarchaeota archaeon]
MKKIKPFPYLIPKPVVLVGALVGGKPNFLTVADVCTTGYKIPRFVISSGKGHYTNEGIIENGTFSVNIPSKGMVAKTDYCGIKSGKKVDKSSLFEIFYDNELKTAPMIKGAPITHACKLVKNVDFGDTHHLFIGEIIETFIRDDLFEEKVPDIRKVDALSYYNDLNYYSVGEKVANAYKVGKEIKR